MPAHARYLSRLTDERLEASIVRALDGQAAHAERTQGRGESVWEAITGDRIAEHTRRQLELRLFEDRAGYHLGTVV